MSISNHELRLNAILSALKPDEKSDAISTLCCLYIPYISKMNNHPINAKFLVEIAKTNYGLMITESIGDIFCRRLAGMGYLKKDGEQRESYIVQINSDSRNRSTPSIIDVYEEVTMLFKNFHLVANSPSYQNWTQEQLGELLVKFLIDFNLHSTDSGAKEKNTPNNLGNSAEQILNQKNSALTYSQTYICARFIQKLNYEDHNLANSISRFVGAGLLAELIEDFKKPTGLKSNSTTIFYLDAPMLLGLIGTSGKEIQKEIKAAVNSLKSIGCKIQVFLESRREAERVLKSYLENDVQYRFGQTHSAVLSGEINLEFVNAVARDVEGALKEFDIAVIPYKLDSYPNSHGYFSDNHSQELYSKLAWNFSDKARQHDTFAATAVMRLRSGKHKYKVLDNSYVFVSSNTRLMQSVNKYCRNSRLLSENHCGPIVDIRDLVAIAWLHTGFSSNEKVPLSHLLAQCEKVLEYKENAINKAKELILNHTSEDDERIAIVFKNNRSVMSLMDSVNIPTTAHNQPQGKNLLDKAFEVAVQSRTEKTDRMLSNEKQKRKQAEKTARDNKEKSKILQKEIDAQNELHKEAIKKGANYVNCFFTLIGFFFPLAAFALFIAVYLCSDYFSSPWIYAVYSLTVIGAIQLAISTAFYYSNLLGRNANKFFHSKIKSWKKNILIWYCKKKNVPIKFADKHIQFNDRKIALRD